MTSFNKFGSSVSKSYFAPLNVSKSPSQRTHSVSSNVGEFGTSDEVDALRWKLFGKNEEFRIMHEAATTIQAFWRGCFSRDMTSEKIESLIEDIMAFRKLEAEYKKRDEEEMRKKQRGIDNACVLDHENGDSDDKYDHDISGHIGSVSRTNKNKPWRRVTERGVKGDELTILSTTSRHISEVVEVDEEEAEREEENIWIINHVSARSISVDNETRGYRRYRTNIHRKNKTRPWRDDTNVFDAY